jgi:hypothetical protein
LVLKEIKDLKEIQVQKVLKGAQAHKDLMELLV